MFVGITCGLSAPYVAGQLDLAMQFPAPSKEGPRGVAAAVLGFNSVDHARDRPIELWDGQRSFRDVLLAMQQKSVDEGDAQRLMVLNPIIGPEPIAGSSRAWS